MKRKPQKRKSQSKSVQSSSRLRPNPGPGAIYIEEFVSARAGRELRYRNIAEHPLTLAHARRRISDDQFAAGEEFRNLYELRMLSGRDSTDFAPGSGGCADMTFTQTQVDAIRRLGRIRERLKQRDWIMLEKFCGEGWPMAEAVRAATVCHPSGVLQRMHEALDELVEARKMNRERSAAA
jgi:hypothetical protein